MTFIAPLAHISPDGRKHGLYEHLFGTANLAAEFAAEFGGGECGYLALRGVIEK